MLQTDSIDSLPHKADQTLQLVPQPECDSASIPQYYKESFFSKSSMWRTEVNPDRYGDAGDPVLYSVRNDDFITGMLLGCFVLAIVAFARSGGFMLRQMKDFFYAPNRSYEGKMMSETGSEFRFQLFLAFQASLLQSIMLFLLTQHYIADTFILSSPYILVLIFLGCIVGYWCAKSILYTFVNWVFFDGNKNLQWQRTVSFVVAMEGIALFPIVMLQIYFDFSMQNAVVFSLIVIGIAKLMAFYKCFTIFFRHIGGFLQIILYFCALEIMPLLLLASILVVIVENLKVIF